MEDLRGFIGRLENEGELLSIHKEIDAWHISALVAQSRKALYFRNAAGFDFPVVSGIINTRRRLAVAK
jgi:2,5-furandicarboxylate decarboxylase 1